VLDWPVVFASNAPTPKAVFAFPVLYANEYAPKEMLLSPAMLFKDE
jgi:hypothetical protein